jgi:hypothetical protein
MAMGKNDPNRPIQYAFKMSVEAAVSVIRNVALKLLRSVYHAKNVDQAV